MKRTKLVLIVLASVLLQACASLVDLSGQTAQTRMAMHAGQAWRMPEGPEDEDSAALRFRKKYIDQRDLIVAGDRLHVDGLPLFYLHAANKALVCTGEEGLPPRLCSPPPSSNNERDLSELPQAAASCIGRAHPLAHWVAAHVSTEAGGSDRVVICVSITLVVDKDEMNDVDHDTLRVSVIEQDGGDVGPGGVSGGPRPTRLKPVQESSSSRRDGI